MSVLDISFHYPPELFNLLVDTIPRLCRSKKDVLVFFQGAGVSARHLADLRQQLSSDAKSINKFDIVRTVLTRLNQDGEAALGQRRAVLRRVVEFEDFTSCWDNDRLEAQGLVANIQRLVGVKDAFTRMKQEADAERAKRQREHEARVAEVAKRRAVRDEIQEDLSALFAESNPWKRGKRLEAVLNRLFEFCGILVREAFTLRGEQRVGIVEQIDGVIELDTHLYLVEMKWHGAPLGVGEIGHHLARVFGRGEMRGLIISDSGYTDPAIDICRGALATRVIALCTLEEIVRLLRAEADLRTLLRTKVQGAMIDKRPFVHVLA